MRFRFTAGLLTAALAASMFTLGAPHASASSKGRKNTTLGLGALALYELLRGNTGTGLLAGAGTAYAYKRYNDARRNDRRSRRYDRYYRSSYRSYDNGYYGDNGYRYVPSRGYYGNSGYQYAPSSYYDNNGERCRRGGSYTTDTWGNRHYYDPRYSDGYHQYGVGYTDGEQCRHGRYSRRYRD